MEKAINNPCSLNHELKWQRRSEFRSAEILDAALSLFVEKGFRATKIADIANEAGVAKGTVYLYFKNKEDIFISMVRELMIPEIERVEIQVADYEGNYTELLVHILQQWWNTINEKKLCGMPKLMVSEAANFPKLAEYYVTNVIHRSLAVVATVIKLGMVAGEFKVCDPDVTARVIISPLAYLAIWSHSLKPFDSQQMDTDVYISQQIDLVLNGIRTEP